MLIQSSTSNPFINMIRKLLCDVILITDNHPTFLDKIRYFASIIATFAPIAFLLNKINLWFLSNTQFASFVLLCIIINMSVGIAFHLKMRTFKWELFIKRNSLMIAVLLVVYFLLEMLRITMGDNIVGEGFRSVIQVSTLLYPSSKALKNAYILSNKQFPPKFIMERLYKFEQSGDLNDLYPNNK